MKRLQLYVCAFLCGSACLSELNAEVEILFIGNSFTVGSGPSVPEIFDALARAGGQEDPTTVMRAVSGRRFSWHAQNSTTLEAINSRDWEYVILQNYSSEPTHIGSVSNHLLYGTMLYDQVIANHSQTQVVLYETWSRSATHELIVDGSFSSTAEMQSELRTNYQLLADQLNANNPGNPPVVVAPCGTAWENSGALLTPGEEGFLHLHGGDEYHANDSGYYLNAAVFYATIYGESPVGLHLDPIIQNLSGLSVPDDRAAFLEEVAWETYLEASGGIELQFVSQPESQTLEERATVTFTASVRGGQHPYERIQWYLNGEPIEGADSLSLSLPLVDRSMDGNVYTVSVFDGETTILSEGASLTVVVDTTPPQVEAFALSTDGRVLTIGFSEALEATTAEDPSGFEVHSQNTHIPAIASALSADGKTVTLTLGAPVYAHYEVGISATLADLSGNSIGSGVVLSGDVPGRISRTVLFDFGGDRFAAIDGNDAYWNNSDTIARTETGTLTGIVDSSGTVTPYTLEMVRRFTGTNTSGTSLSTVYPGTATGDTNYGNTAEWSGYSNVFPAFRITNLDPGATYALLFYASRMNVSDNRETEYTVTGEDVRVTTLNPSNNVDGYAELTGLKVDQNNQLLIEIHPGANNTNAQKFTYLGVLELVVEAAPSRTLAFDAIRIEPNQVVLEWNCNGSLDTSDAPMGPWEAVVPAPDSPFIAEVDPARPSFFRLRGD